MGTDGNLSEGNDRADHRTDIPVAFTEVNSDPSNVVGRRGIPGFLFIMRSGMQMWSAG